MRQDDVSSVAKSLFQGVISPITLHPKLQQVKVREQYRLTLDAEALQKLKD